MWETWAGRRFIMILSIWCLSCAAYGQAIRPDIAAKVADPWKKSDVILTGVYWLGSVLDAGQTVYGLKRGAVEKNPIWGKKPSRQKIYAGKLLLGGIATYIVHRTPAKERKTLLLIMNSIQWSAVLWNGLQPGIGLRIQF